jgi:integrase
LKTYQRKPYIPVVLSRDEVDKIIKHLQPPYDLVVKMLYGCGLRLFECLRLRVQCLNFMVFSGHSFDPSAGNKGIPALSSA